MKKRKLVVSTLLSLCVLSTLTITFSLSWLSNPIYNDIIITTGDYPLTIKTNIYLLKENPTDNTNSRLNQNLLGDELKANHVSKTVENGKIYVDGSEISDSSTGTLTINFSNLSYEFFNNTVMSYIYEYDDFSSLSDTTYTLKNEFFHFAFIEFIFIKPYFSAYLNASLSIEINGSNIPDELIKINSIEDTINKNKIELLKDYNGETYADDNLKALTNSDPSSYESLPNTIKVTEDNTQIIGNPNTITVDDKQKECYALAKAYSLYLNPFVYFPYIKENGSINFSLNIVGSFLLSDQEIK
ncbi:MAG: hypothetical protein ACI31G_00025 [Bacilli bacterium]